MFGSRISGKPETYKVLQTSTKALKTFSSDHCSYENSKFPSLVSIHPLVSPEGCSTEASKTLTRSCHKTTVHTVQADRSVIIGMSTPGQSQSWQSGSCQIPGYCTSWFWLWIQAVYWVTKTSSATSIELAWKKTMDHSTKTEKQNPSSLWLGL